jgi:hypothetical protein
LLVKLSGKGGNGVGGRGLRLAQDRRQYKQECESE